MARKLKIKIKINRFYIFIPSIPLSFVSRILKFSFKHSGNHLSADLSKIKPEEINRLVEVLKNTETFELVNINVDDQESKVFIKIYTK